ncbi:MAG: radical SAM protein [Eggerthellaceae bacterium]|jgi:MoaA/NifB/PqqE/SkfB family radical SAM enzyme
MGAKQKLERAGISRALDYVIKDPEQNVPKIMDIVDTLVPDNVMAPQRKMVRNAIDSKGNWYRYILRLTTEMDEGVARRLLKSLVLDVVFDAWPIQEANREKYQCNIPWAILLDPTSACNLHCTGCWAADYGHQLNLSFEDIDSIIEQGKALGVHLYIYTGGEPLVRKKDVIRLCEKHQDCVFLSFTNATLIDEEFCADMKRVANFVPAISVEGFGEATDARRGAGTFAKVSHAMDLLRGNGLPFGVSTCYTSQNYQAIATEEFFDWMIDKGALFAWFFTYMPIGKNAPTDLMATPAQREELYHFIRRMRDEKPLFTMDFWNDGEYVGGCIAGGRRYLHINANGDVEPCVFAHYSNANIHDTSLLDALRSPLFMAYYRNQPFSGNLLRPCPILDNQGELARIVRESGAKSTDLDGAEDAGDLCAKCIPVADAWEPVANRLWENPADPRYPMRHSGHVGQADSDLRRLERLERKLDHQQAPDAQESTASEKVLEEVAVGK